METNEKSMRPMGMNEDTFSEEEEHNRIDEFSP